MMAVCLEVRRKKKNQTLLDMYRELWTQKRQLLSRNYYTGAFVMTTVMKPQQLKLQ